MPQNATRAPTSDTEVNNLGPIEARNTSFRHPGRGRNTEENNLGPIEAVRRSAGQRLAV